VFNVQQDASLHDDSYDSGEITKEILGDANAQYHYRHLANVDESIREFCHNEQIDWLAVTPGKYSFLEGLFHSSHTKALAKTLNIPLLILH
jgi:nucleotide-binding universal stress UspA family protein